jgi:hypothetical protein
VGLVVGVPVGLAAVLAGLALLFAGTARTTRGESSPSRARAPKRRLTPAEARRLKREAILEFKHGRAIYQSAGEFGSPGYAEKMSRARGCFQKAIESFSAAQDVLRSDPELDFYSEQCGRLLSASFKVPVRRDRGGPSGAR